MTNKNFYKGDILNTNKKLYLISLSILICLGLVFCTYILCLFAPIYIHRPSTSNSATNITTYNPGDVPVELTDILSRQTYPAVYLDELEKNTYLLHDSRSIEQAFLHIKVSAKLINRVVYVNIKKFKNVDEADNNTPNELISVITVPDDKYVYDIKIRTQFTPYSPWVNKPQLENIEQ